MNTLQTAKTFRNLGISTIPIKARSKRPAISRWRPYIDQLPREVELRAWFESGERNIAVLTGGECGLVVLDFDSHWRFSCWLANLPPTLAKIVLTTYRVATRRGLHCYFYIDEPTQGTSLIWDYCSQCCKRTLHQRVPGRLKQVVCQDCLKVHDPLRIGGTDVKAHHGYVIASPSTHPTGHIYRAIGSPSQIQCIESIEVLLPEIGNRMNHESCRLQRASQPKNNSLVEGSKHIEAKNLDGLDSLDVAMLHNAAPSLWGDLRGGGENLITRIKATWSFADFLNSSNGRQRGVTMVNCPLHHDTEASLAIYPPPDHHGHCFGCGWHGDVLDMYAAMHNLTITEAVRMMAQSIP